jgi:hypothetical protein
LLSPSCGFATDSTILEMQQARMLGAARIFGGAKQARMPEGPGPCARCCSAAIARLRAAPSGLVLIMVLRRHLPFGPKAFLVLLALSNESR